MKSAILALLILSLVTLGASLSFSHQEQHTLESEAHFTDSPDATKISDSLKLISSGIKTGPNSSVLASGSLPELKIESSSCSLQQSEKESINAQASSLKTKLEDLFNQESNATAVNNVLLADIINNQAYVDAILKEVSSNSCDTLWITKTTFQTNIYSTNWLLGSQSIGDLVQEYAERSMNEPSVANCPLEEPYFNGYFCTICHPPLLLFNLETQSCTSCPDNQEYNDTQRNCVEKPKPNGNFEGAENLVGEASGIGGVIGGINPNSSNFVPCPKSTPYFDGENCISCNSNHTLFNVTSKTCVSCPPGQNYDSLIKKCTLLPPNATLASASNLLGATSNQSVANGPNDIPCSTNTPYFNGKECIACSSPTILFSIATKTCTACKGTQIYDASSKFCINPSPNATNPNASNLLLTNPNHTSTNGSNDVSCPLDTPYYDGTKCIACNGNSTLFNVTSKTCTSCPPKQKYDPAAFSCSALPSNQTLASAPNLLLSNPNQTITNGPNDIPCPAVTPYYDGSKCIACNGNSTLFNITSKTCTSCPPKENYDSITFSCSLLPPNQTLASAPNLLLSNPNQTITNGPNDIPCPSATPYFNSSKCIACSGNATLFNLTSKACTSCPPKEAYNSTTSTCAPLSPNSTLASASNLLLANASQTLLNNSNDIPCPSATPYFDGSKCISCSGNATLFNITSKACSSCPPKESYNPATFACSLLPPNQTLSSALNLLLASPNQTITNGPNDIPCPSTTPYFDGSKCISCSGNATLFNITSKTCTSCPPKENYDSNTFSCSLLLPPNATIAVAADLLFSKPNQTITNGPNDILCPSATPYFDGSKCISCSGKASLFNVTSKACSSCPENYAYSSMQRYCISLVPNATLYESSTLNRTILSSSQIPSNKISDLPCPSTSPFFIQNACKDCTGSTPLFNQSSDSCSSCPQNTVFDQSSHSCVIKFITNLNSANLLNDGMPSDYYSAVYNQTKTNPSIQDCPAATPYYNGSVCISCPDAVKKYFSLHYQTCTNCTAPNTYDAPNHECIVDQTANSSISPNLAQLSSSILGHHDLDRHALGLSRTEHSLEN